MPSKTEEYLALAQRTANGLTRYWESWTDYLTTASRLYKYPFADQLMIYASATKCAEQVVAEEENAVALIFFLSSFAVTQILVANSCLSITVFSL